MTSIAYSKVSEILREQTHMFSSTEKRCPKKERSPTAASFDTPYPRRKKTAE